MSIQLVTGHAGSAHVTSAQDGRLNAAAWGAGKYVLPTQAQFAITVDSANQVTVATGDAMLEGRHVTSEAPTTLAVDSGTQGMKRNDLVCIVYTKNGSGVESAELRVVKGTETSGTPSDPAVPSGSVLDGDSTCAMALWRLPVVGVSLGTPERMVEPSAAVAEDASVNYTYEASWSAAAHAVVLEGGNGAESSQAVVPLAYGVAPGLVRVGSGITNTDGTISVQTSTTSRDGLMTADQAAALARVTSGNASYNGSLMGFGYQNGSGGVYLYFPVNAVGRTTATVQSMANPDCIGAGGRATMQVGLTKTAALRNGGTLLEVHFDAAEPASVPHYNVFTAWVSSIRVTFA